MGVMEAALKVMLQGHHSGVEYVFIWCHGRGKATDIVFLSLGRTWLLVSALRWQRAKGKGEVIALSEVCIKQIPMNR